MSRGGRENKIMGYGYEQSIKLYMHIILKLLFVYKLKKLTAIIE